MTWRFFQREEWTYLHEKYINNRVTTKTEATNDGTRCPELYLIFHSQKMFQDHFLWYYCYYSVQVSCCEHLHQLTTVNVDWVNPCVYSCISSLSFYLLGSKFRTCTLNMWFNKMLGAEFWLTCCGLHNSRRRCFRSRFGRVVTRHVT